MHPSLPRPHHRQTRHTADLACQVVREHDFCLIADRIANLSPTGVLVTPADPVVAGEKLIVSFKSPGWGVWIDTEATVARVLHGRRPGEYCRALGLQFDDLGDWSRYVLERNLRWMPPAPPGPTRGHRSAVSSARILAFLSGHAARPLN